MKTDIVARSSISLALIIALEIADSLFPISQLFTLAICTVIIFIITKHDGITVGIILYSTACVLILLILPNKQKALLFAVMFGFYGVLKTILDRIKPFWFSIIIKILALDGLLFLWILIMEKILGIEQMNTYIMDSRMLFVGVLIIVQVIFLSYDFLINYVAVFLEKRLFIRR